MGNSLLGGKKTAKVMKINGETMKFKIPIQAKEVVKDYPGHVILDSEAVKHYGIRAKPLDPFQNLEPKRLYFLVELPKFPHHHENHHDNHHHHGNHHREPRRVRSGINMSAKDRLESLMLSRRSASDLSIMGPAARVVVADGGSDGGGGGGGGGGAGLRVRMRLPKVEVERLVKESRGDKVEVAEKIMDLCMEKTGHDDPINNKSNGNKGKEVVAKKSNFLDHPVAYLGGPRSGASYKKRVDFLPTHGEIGLAVASL